MRPDHLSLAQTQEALFALITGRKVGSRPPVAASFVRGDARASAAERVAVYAFMYRARLVEALESQFPRLAKWLGSAVFTELVHGYVDEHPSTRPSLRFLGAMLPDWLSRRHPELHAADLARLEWARADIFDARDESALGLESIRAWPQDHFAELPITLIAAHRLLRLDRGTAEVWRRVGDDRAAAEEQRREPGSESVLVWREGVSVFHRTVDEAERESLALAAAGTSLGRICESAGASADVHDAIGQAFGWVWSWANDGLLRSIRQPAPAGDAVSGRGKASAARD